MNLAQDIHKFWAILNAVMNLQVKKYAGSFLTSQKIVSFSRRLPHMELV